MASESASTHTFGIVAATIVIVAGGVGVAAAILVPALNEPQPVLDRHERARPTVGHRER